jgi:hypothetical protein
MMRLENRHGSNTIASSNLALSASKIGIGVGVGTPGAYYGMYVAAFGTSPVFTVYDIVPARGGVAVATNILHNGTATAFNQNFAPVSGLGIRYNGALVIAVTGTANTLNALWEWERARQPFRPKIKTLHPTI